MSSSAPVWEALQHGVQHVHAFTGLPWWVTLGICSVTMRMTMFPLVIMQIRTVRAMTAGAGGAHLQHITKLTIAEYLKSPSTRPKTIKLYLKGLRGISKMFNLRPWRALISPAVHLPCLFTFMLATRDMVRGETFDMSTGGALWFTDLGAVDTTMVLPCVAVGVTYWNLERAFGRGDAVTVSQVFRELFQTGVICSLPFVMNLPAGVFMLWIPSGLYTLSQSSFLATPFMQSVVMLYLPPPLEVGPDGYPLPPDTEAEKKGKTPQKLSMHPPPRARRVPFPMRVQNEGEVESISGGDSASKLPLPMQVQGSSKGVDHSDPSSKGTQ